VIIAPRGFFVKSYGYYMKKQPHTTKQTHSSVRLFRVPKTLNSEISFVNVQRWQQRKPFPVGNWPICEANAVGVAETGAEGGSRRLTDEVSINVYSNICVKILILLLIHRYAVPLLPQEKAIPQNAFICFRSKNTFSIGKTDAHFGASVLNMIYL